MRLLALASVVFFSLALGPVVAQQKATPPDLKGKSVKQVFDELLPKMDTQAAQQQWQSICFALSAPGNEVQRAEACKLMAEKLDAKTPNPARVWLLKQLERIGREECVDAVTGVLDDKDDLVRDGAIRCLANNPAAPATARLLARLPNATGKDRVGIVNALGLRRDASALSSIAKELANSDAPVAIAAARSLGKLATPDAAKALAASRSKAQGELRLAISDAWLLCADKRLQEGKTAEAAAIYQELNKPEEARPTRLAALQGLLRTAGDQAGTMVLDILGKDDAGARAIAIGQIENLSAAALKPLAASIDKLSVGNQVLVLNAIAARGDKSQLPVALAAAQSTNEPVKRAGIQALGRLGDAAVVPQLLTTLFAGGNLGGTAAESLVQLASDGVNEKLTAALEAEKSSARMAALIGVLERRKTAAAVPVLLKAAASDDAALRASAFSGLRNLAEPKHVPEMVLALVKTAKGKERDQAELAVVAVCGQIAEPAKRAEPVLAMINNGAKAHKPALLPLVGRLGGPDARKVVNEALAASEPQLHEAAVVALCNWPDQSVSDDLLKLLQTAKEPERFQPPLVALIRVNTFLSADRTNEDKLASLAVLKKAMELAKTDEQRKLILEGIGFIRHLETFRFVLPYLDNKELAQSACKAVVEVAHSKPVREPNKAEFDKALDRVMAMCKDKALVDRARQYKLGQ
jgi:HEAT repeat protein